MVDIALGELASIMYDGTLIEVTGIGPSDGDENPIRWQGECERRPDYIHAHKSECPDTGTLAFLFPRFAARPPAPKPGAPGLLSRDCTQPPLSGEQIRPGPTRSVVEISRPFRSVVELAESQAVGCRTKRLTSRQF